MNYSLIKKKKKGTRYISQLKNIFQVTFQRTHLSLHAYNIDNSSFFEINYLCHISRNT